MRVLNSDSGESSSPLTRSWTISSPVGEEIGHPAAVGRQCDHHGVRTLGVVVEQVDGERPERPGLRDEADGFRRAAGKRHGRSQPDRRQRSRPVTEVR